MNAASGQCCQPDHVADIGDRWGAQVDSVLGKEDEIVADLLSVRCSPAPADSSDADGDDYGATVTLEVVWQVRVPSAADVATACEAAIGWMRRSMASGSPELVAHHERELAAMLQERREIREAGERLYLRQEALKRQIADAAGGTSTSAES
jgi:hypothetical protein